MSGVPPKEPPQHETLADPLAATMASPRAGTLDAATAPAALEAAQGQTLDSTSPATSPMHSPVVSVQPFPVANWDRYEFIALLGRGGMGAVYRARDRRLGREVALKFIFGESPGQIQRFMQEARAQARLDHPHICKVYEVGLVENKPYIAMQLVPGLALDRAARAMSLNQKVQVVRDVAEAMHYAHSQGIIHRDLKPSNILVTRSLGSDGGVLYEPVVMDFGLAHDNDDRGGLTASGDVLGTPAYMSPEQARGDTRRLDARSDVYSLGATLYDLLSGKPPFDDETVVNIILQVINAPPRPLRQHDANLPEALELIVGKCLNKEPAQRYATAKDLADDLGRFLGAQRVAARRLGYLYRIGYFARKNPALATLGSALLISLIGLFSFFVQARFAALRKERLAQQEAEQAQKLGQAVKDLEWLVRTANLLPLHDANREKRVVRERMAEITSDLKRQHAAGAERLGAYVLGRGHLALQDWDAAHRELKRAEALGYRDPELSYALGRVLGEQYSRALDEARRSGDKSYVKKRRAELEAQYLVPARRYLQNSRSLRTVSTSYIEALIDYYNQHYDAALLNAQQALAQQGWLYEALKLQGDVHLSRALDARDHGDPGQAERHFSDAVRLYEDAASIGHSDRLIYEALAETWIRQEEMDMIRGVDPSPKLGQALAAAERALEAGPQESFGHTKKAFAYFFSLYFRQSQQKTAEVKALAQQVIQSAEAALRLHPEDAFAYDVMGNAYTSLGSIGAGSPEENQRALQKAITYLSRAIQLSPRFAWAYNDLGSAYLFDGIAVQTTVERKSKAIDAAVRNFSAASQIDPEYLSAMNNLAGALTERVSLAAEHGQDPSEYFGRIRAIGEKLEGSSMAIYALGNIATSSLPMATYLRYKLENNNTVLDIAEAALTKMVTLNAAMSGPYTQLADVAHRRAMLPSTTPSQLAAQVRAGRAQLKKCYAIEPKNSECHSLDLLLDVAEIVRAPEAAAALATYRRAFGKAKVIDWKSEQNPATLTNYAEGYLQLVEWKLSQRLPAAPELALGLQAVERLTQLTSSLPKAWALRGAFLVFESRGLAEESKKRARYDEAWRSFERAFGGNPLLRGFMGKLATEAQQGRSLPRPG